MKSILYVGAMLMIGASIYGFVDYKKTSRNKVFKSLYQEEKTDKHIINEEIGVPAVTTNPVIRIDEKDELAAGKTTSDNYSNISFKKKKIKKELNYKLFSRAPLREYVEEPVTPKVRKLEKEEAHP